MHLLNGYQNGMPMWLNAEQLPLVRVTGEGRMEVRPDTAVVVLGFATRTDTADAAYRQTAGAMSQVVQALRQAGIPEEQMQTEQVTLRPVYEKEQLVGYEGSATLQVTLKDLAAVGPTIDTAVASGANRVQGVSFEVRDPAQYEAAALTLAVREAHRTAELLARSMGIGLGPVWHLEAEPAPGPIRPMLGRAALTEGMPVLPGTLAFTRRVRADYLILYPNG